LCLEPELSLCVHLKKHEQHQKYSYSTIGKKELLPGFPLSLSLKAPQAKLTSLIPTERLQEISWQDFWRSHAPRGASIKLKLEQIERSIFFKKC